MSDDGPGPEVDCGESDRGTGLGLDNTRRRLAHLYGDDQVLRLTRDGQWTRVRVELPFHVLANAGPPAANGGVAA